MTRRTLIIVGLLTIATALPAQAAVEARLVRVGLFAGGQNSARRGCMSFAEVELRNRGAEPFNGDLRLSEIDRDGDVVVSVLESVVVEPDNTWKSFEIYFMPNTRFSRAPGLTIRLYDDDGALVDFYSDAGVPLRQLDVGSILDEPAPEHLLIGVLTDEGLPPQITFIANSRYESQKTFFNERHVRAFSPRELPTRGSGLDALDVLIWRDADPSALRPSQVEAMRDWVERGGRLLITVASNWQKFQGNPAGDLIGLEFTGVEETSNADRFFDVLSREYLREDYQKHYDRNPLTRCLVDLGNDCKPFPADHPEDEAFFFRREMGRGWIIVSTALLTDLIPEPSQKTLKGSSESAERERENYGDVIDRFAARTLLGLPRARPTDVQGNMLLGDNNNLFAQVLRQIGFSGVTAAYLFFAIAFAALYTFVATFGTYLYLRKKDLTRHSWLVFTVAGFVGTFIGTGIVWVLRGFSTQVAQTGVVDAYANNNYGYGTFLFGVKAHEYTQLDVRLPVGYETANRDHGPIAVLPTLPTGNFSESTFSATDKYRHAQAATAIQAVPVRATLKEFIGEWHGELGGSFDARLIYDTDKREFTEDSFLRNNLGFELRDCYLLYVDQLVAGSGNIDTIGVPIGNFAESGDRAILQGEAFFNKIYLSDKRDANGDFKKRGLLEMSVTQILQKCRNDSNWGLTGPALQDRREDIKVDQIHAPYLLLSFFNLQKNFEKAALFKQSLARGWDCSHRLTENLAMVVGFARTPPKARLEIDRIAETPGSSLTLYRFMIPVERR